MLKFGVFATLSIVSAIAFQPSAKAGPMVPEHSPAVSSILPVQGYWERCRYLRERIREIEERLYYAPPYERPRLERRLFDRREEFRATCRRGGY